ncbi:MAG: TetR/AcrR family transcriptional regulator [Bdellovibrionales bacterium]|nr:TetR/AcrR family transcriptional regulator [Bdellovibrionales bacterium]
MIEPASTRTQKRAIETRKKIFATAIELFQKQGFENTTVAQITDAADVGKGTFFSHFPTKEAVLGDIGFHIVEEMKLVHQQAEKRKWAPLREIEELLVAGAQWHSQHRELSRLVSGLILLHPSAMQADLPNIMWLLQLIGSRLSEAKKNKELIPSVDIAVAVQSLLGVYFFSIMGWHRDGGQGDVVATTTKSVRYLLRGLSR